MTGVPFFVIGELFPHHTPLRISVTSCKFNWTVFFPRNELCGNDSQEYSLPVTKVLNSF